MTDHPNPLPAGGAHQRVEEGLETAGPDQLTPSQQAIMQAMDDGACRIMTKGVELKLDYELIELMEAAIGDRYDRLTVMVKTYEIVALLYRENPLAAERYQHHLKELYRDHLSESPLNVAIDNVKSGAGRLPSIAATAAITAIVTLVVAVIWIKCGLPPAA